MIDFPNSPTIGEVFTSGTASWTWDGTKWVMSGGASTSYVLKAGDTMTGNLVVAPAAGTSDVQVKAIAGQTAQVSLWDGATAKFTLGKSTVNSFSIFDAANATTALTVATTGLVNVGEVGVAGVTVGSGTNPGANNLAVTGTIATRGATGSYLIGDQGGAGAGWEMYGTSSLAAWKYGGTAQAWFDTNGNITIIGPTAVKAGGGAWIAPSSVELKSDVVAYSRGLAEIVRLNPVLYSYNGKGGLATEQRFAGLTAEDVAPVMPEMLVPLTLGAAGEERIETTGVDTGPLLMALVNAVKEMSARLAALEGKT